MASNERERPLADTSHALEASAEHGLRRRGLWRWVVWTALVGAVVVLVVGEVMVRRAGPILKGRVIETLSARFNSRVEMDGFDVSVMKGLEVSGSGLRIFPQDEVVEAGATEPLIAIGVAFPFMQIWRGCLRSRCVWGRCM